MNNGFVTLVLCVFFFFSCSKKVELSGSNPLTKKLDTTFLKLGKVGTQEVEVSTIKASERVHILNNNQNIHIKSNKGLIEIENFDQSLLKNNDIIVGNQNDKYLFLVEDINVQGNSTQVKIKQASISDFDENVQMKLNFTPKISYLASEGKSFNEVAQSTLGSAAAAGGSSDKSSPNPNKENIISFKNYEIINTKDTRITEFNKIPGNKIEVDAGEDLKVTIDRGYLEMIPTFSGDYDVSFRSGLDLSATLNSYLKYRFQVTVETTEPTIASISFPLFKDISIPIRTMAGTVPIYIDLNLAFPAGFKIYSSKKGKVTFTVENEYAMNALAQYDSENGAHYDGHYDYVIKEQKITMNDTSVPEAQYALEVFFNPQVKTKLYKVLGPYAYINTNIQADVSLPLKTGKDDLFINFSAGIGLDVEDPIFNSSVLSMKSDSLYNYTKGWDIIGPKSNSSGTSLSTTDELNLGVDKLNDDGSIAVKLRPNNSSPLTQVNIHKMPEFGKLVRGDNFAFDGIAYYYPPQVIEGRDSFQVITIQQGAKSQPTRVMLELSSQAKQQAKEPLNVLPRYQSKRSTQVSSVSVGKMITSSNNDNFILIAKKISNKFSKLPQDWKKFKSSLSCPSGQFANDRKYHFNSSGSSLIEGHLPGEIIHASFAATIESYLYSENFWNYPKFPKDHFDQHALSAHSVLYEGKKYINITIATCIIEVEQEKENIVLLDNDDVFSELRIDHYSSLSLLESLEEKQESYNEDLCKYYSPLLINLYFKTKTRNILSFNSRHLGDLCHETISVNDTFTKSGLQ